MLLGKRVTGLWYTLADLRLLESPSGRIQIDHAALNDHYYVQ